MRSLSSCQFHSLRMLVRQTQGHRDRVSASMAILDRNASRIRNQSTVKTVNYTVTWEE